MVSITALRLIGRAIVLWLIFIPAFLWIELMLLLRIGDPEGLLNICDTVGGMAEKVKSDAAALLAKSEREGK